MESGAYDLLVLAKDIAYIMHQAIVEGSQVYFEELTDGMLLSEIVAVVRHHDPAFDPSVSEEEE